MSGDFEVLLALGQALDEVAAGQAPAAAGEVGALAGLAAELRDGVGTATRSSTAPPGADGRPEPARPLGQVIDALLEPDPSGRPGSAEEVLGALAAALPSGDAGLPWPGWATRLLERAG